MPTSFQCVGVCLCTLEERPLVVAHNVGEWRRVQSEAMQRCQDTAREKTGEGTHDSLADGGILALPLNWSVISLMEVGSDR